MIRRRSVPISEYLYSLARICAEKEGVDCAETLIELWLSERLEAMPEIVELHKMRSDARREADAKWRAKYVKGSE